MRTRPFGINAVPCSTTISFPTFWLTWSGRWMTRILVSGWRRCMLSRVIDVRRAGADPRRTRPGGMRQEAQFMRVHLRDLPKPSGRESASSALGGLRHRLAPSWNRLLAALAVAQLGFFSGLKGQ